MRVGNDEPAVTARYRVYLTSAADLAARCHRAAIEGKKVTTMRFFAVPTLLIADELGYLLRSGEAASALFRVGAWGETLRDITVAAVMLDRLPRRSVVVTFDGASTDSAATTQPPTNAAAPPLTPTCASEPRDLGNSTSWGTLPSSSGRFAERRQHHREGVALPQIAADI